MKKEHIHDLISSVYVIHIYIIHRGFFPLDTILSYHTVQVLPYKHSQLANILPSHTGSWVGARYKHFNKKKHGWIPLFHIKQKTWVLLFLSEDIYIYSSFLNFPKHKKKYAGHFWEKGPTHPFMICAFFF